MNEKSARLAEINVPYPEVEALHLRLAVGACRLRVQPSLIADEGGLWVAGTYDDTSGHLPLKLEQDGGTVRISQEHKLSEWRNPTTPPTFDLTLGKRRPFRLTVETGASEAEVELGGLPISHLSVRQGAGWIRFSFDAPNPYEMSLFELHSGAGEVQLFNLANANLEEMNLEGGATAYLLDFGGRLQGDTQVRITVAIASLEIRIPTTTAARVISEGTLSSVTASGFTQRQDDYWNEAALAEHTPLLAIRAKTTMGSVTLRSN